VVDWYVRAYARVLHSGYTPAGTDNGRPHIVPWYY